MSKKMSLTKSQLEAFRNFIVNCTPPNSDVEYNNIIEETSKMSLYSKFLGMKTFPQAELSKTIEGFDDPRERSLGWLVISVLQSQHAAAHLPPTGGEESSEEEEEEEEQESEPEEDEEGGAKVPGFLLKVKSISDIDQILERMREKKSIGFLFRISDYTEVFKKYFGMFVKAALSILLFITGATILDKLAEFLKEKHSEKKAVIWLARTIDVAYRVLIAVFAVIMFVLRPDKFLKKLLPEEAQEYLPTSD